MRGLRRGNRSLRPRTWLESIAVVRAGESDAKAKQAVVAAKAAGYTIADGEVGQGEIDCDHGARAVLKLDATAKYMSTSILFATRAQAAEFVAAYQPGVVGTAAVQTYCVD